MLVFRKILRTYLMDSPEDHGWMLDNDNDKLDIRWVGCNAAPDEIILQVLFSPQNSF